MTATTGNGVSELAAATVLDRILTWARERPDAPALNDGTSRTSYRELDELTQRLAGELRRRGARPGVPVAVLLGRGPQLALCAVAALRAGCVYLPIDRTYPLARIRQVLDGAQASMLVYDEGSAAIAAQLPGALDARELFEAARTATPAPAAEAPSPQAPAYLIYTSGSTGEPKGVLVGRGALDLHVDDVVREFRLGPKDRILQFCSAGFDPSVQDIFMALTSGGELVFAPERPPDAHGFLELLADRRITAVLLPTAYWSLLARQFGEQPRTVAAPPAACPLRVLLVGGEAMAVETARQWARGPLAEVELYNAYGPTETVIMATLHRVRAADLAAAGATVPIGRVLGHRDLLVLDEQERPAELGGVGELWIGGACVALGYLNRPDLTAERFVERVGADGATGRYYRTGDRVRVLDDGELEFLGRVDNQVKFRGYRFELAELESALRNVPGVGEARALVLESGGLNPVLRAVIVPAASDIAADELVGAVTASLRTRLPEYMVPTQILVLDALPMTAHGKVDNVALAALPAVSRTADGRAGTDCRGGAVHPLEALLFELFPEVCDLDGSFADAGVGSLAVMLFTSRAANRGWVVDQRSAWAGTAVRTVLHSATAVSAAPRTALEPDTRAVPCTPVQRRVLDEIGADRDHWNSSLLLDLAPGVDLDALRRELRSLVEQNPILTARIDPAGGGRMFAGRHAASGLVSTHRLTDDEVTAYSTGIQRSLSVSEGPLSRAVILVGPETSRLLLVAHRLVADSYSLELLADRIEARLAGHPVAPEPNYLDWADAVWSARTETELSEAAAAFAALPWDRCPRIGPAQFPEHGESVKLKAGFAADGAGPVSSDGAVRAVARALAVWTGASAVRFDIQHHGRFPVAAMAHPELAVGPFTCAVPTVLRPGPAEGWRLPDALAYGLLTRPAAGAPRIRVPRSEIQFNHRIGLVAGPRAEDARLLRPSALSAGPEKGPAARERYLLKIATDLGEHGPTVSVLYNTRTHDRADAEKLLALLRRELAVA